MPTIEEIEARWSEPKTYVTQDAADVHYLLSRVRELEKEKENHQKRIADGLQELLSAMKQREAPCD